MTTSYIITAEPAPPPLNNGPSLIPIFPQTFSFSLVYSLLRAGINQSVSDTEVQEFLEQESGESQPEDSESDKSTTSGEPEWSRDLQYMHFSHSTNEPQRGDDDYNRLFKVHRIMYMVLSNLKHVYDPSKPMSIDKGMIAYKGHLSFRQFMPAKLTKYGVKGWMAANAKMVTSQILLFTSTKQKKTAIEFTVLAMMLSWKWLNFIKQLKALFFHNFSQVWGFINFWPKICMWNGAL